MEKHILSVSQDSAHLMTMNMTTDSISSKDSSTLKITQHHVVQTHMTYVTYSLCGTQK